MTLIKHSKILKSDWDVLIILDACRYDTFKKVFNELKVNKANSEASHTTRWLKEHFLHGNYHDVIYVSGNPFINSSGYKFPSPAVFCEIFDVWNSGFDNRTGIVKASSVTFDAQNVIFSYP